MSSNNTTSRATLIAVVVVTAVVWFADQHLATLPVWVQWVVFFPHRLLVTVATWLGVSPDNRNIFSVMFGLPAIAIYWAAAVNWISRGLNPSRWE